MTKLSKIEVPLVQDDLRYPETIIQIANTLDILDQCIRNVFSHVNQSIGRTRQNLRSIQERNNAVSAKIEQLKSIQKSVTIVSKNKYPYEDTRNFDVAFQAEPRLVFDKLPAGVSSSESPASDMESKLKFYHAKTGDDMLRKNVDLVSEETLGKLPAHVDSITSCLLFNTTENVYEKYVICDPLSPTSEKKPVTELTDTSVTKMEDAPKSLHQGEDFPHRKPEFVYSPSVEDVPVIELPQDLPDLMGFADDFRYTGENVVEVTQPVVPVSTGQPLPPKEAVVQPPPSVPSPPPPTQAAPQPSSAPPPPPPLPPPDAPPAAPEPSSLHANLMAAIRTAGGTGKAKLRAVGQEPPPGPRSPCPPRGLDVGPGGQAAAEEEGYIRREGGRGRGGTHGQVAHGFAPSPSPGWGDQWQ